ncbi:MAG: ABC transporter permease subunit [Spirochaetaceae bacterium]
MNKKKLIGRAQDKQLLLILIIPFTVMLVYNYLPMAGIFLAFKDFRYDLGFLKSPWVGFKNFEFFFKTDTALRITRNTIGYNVLFIICNTVGGVALALLLNEVISKKAIKFYQTALFLPYYISWVVVSYMAYSFLSSRYGILNQLLLFFNIDSVNWYTNPKSWPMILIFFNTWKNIGYWCIIFYAGLISVDKQLYEAAAIDGVGRWKQTIYISLPHIRPLITIMVLLSIGRIFYADFGLFYNVPRNLGILYKTTDVMDTYVYRSLKVTGDLGMATAAGLYQSIVGLITILIANGVVNKWEKDSALF